jgi:uncharacterized protein (DUF1697 family)
MNAHIALLRGVNVGGSRMVAMADLRALIEQLSFTDVRSLLQSGNLVFESERRTCEDIERLLETQVQKQLELATTFFVRTATEWQKIIVKNPFPKEAAADPSHLIVMFLKDKPKLQNIVELQAATVGSERVKILEKQAYIVYPEGIGRSKMTNALIERKLQTQGTGRNWNTVLKLAAMVDAVV